MSMHKTMTGIVGLVAVIGLLLGLASLDSEQAAPSTDDLAPTKLAGINRTGIFQQNLWQFANGILLNEDGNVLTHADECTLITGSAVQSASSTRPYDCAVPGVKAGDLVQAWISTSTPISTGNTYWDIMGAKSSTTDGYITVLLRNNGTAMNPSQISVGSSTGFMVFRP
jgi:hypothetical protein